MIAVRSQVDTGVSRVVYGRLRSHATLVARCQVKNSWADFLWRTWTVAFDMRAKEEWNR